MSLERTTLRSAYLYVICLVTLVLALFATVNLVRNAVQLLYPDPGYYAVEPVFGPDGKAALDPEDQARREQAAKDSQRHQAVLGLVGSGTMLAISGPVYLYHWRRVQAEHGARSGGAAVAAG